MKRLIENTFSTRSELEAVWSGGYSVRLVIERSKAQALTGSFLFFRCLLEEETLLLVPEKN